MESCMAYVSHSQRTSSRHYMDWAAVGPQHQRLTAFITSRFLRFWTLTAVILIIRCSFLGFASFLMANQNMANSGSEKLETYAKLTRLRGQYTVMRPIWLQMAQNAPLLATRTLSPLYGELVSGFQPHCDD